MCARPGLRNGSLDPHLQSCCEPPSSCGDPSHISLSIYIIYVYIYIYIYVCVYIYIYIYICVYVYIYIYICIYTLYLSIDLSIFVSVYLSICPARQRVSNSQGGGDASNLPTKIIPANIYIYIYIYIYVFEEPHGVLLGGGRPKIR